MRKIGAMRPFTLRWRLALLMGALVSFVILGLGVGASWRLYREGIRSPRSAIFAVWRRSSFRTLDDSPVPMDWMTGRPFASSIPRLTRDRGNRRLANGLPVIPIHRHRAIVEPEKSSWPHCEIAIETPDPRDIRRRKLPRQAENDEADQSGP